MEIQIQFCPSGKVKIETVSILEDLWHDYQFFKSQAANLEQTSVTPDELFLVKRYRRAAILMLVFYFEGVVNHWVKHLLDEPDWLNMERKPLEKKVRFIEEKLAPRTNTGVDVSEVKSIRNALAHLKPGGDVNLFEAVTESLLTESESAITGWLDEVEGKIGVERHPNTREVSRLFTDDLGVAIPGSEGYSSV